VDKYVTNFDTEACLKTKEIEDGTEMLQTVSNVLILYISCTMFYTVKQSIVHDSWEIKG